MVKCTNWLIVVSSILTNVIVLQADAQDESLGEMVDRVTYAWDTESIDLETYSGLTKFCQDVSYRSSIIELMNEIHHLDSMLYEKAKLAQSRSSDKEIAKLIKEIENFEAKFSPRNFIHFLKEECDSEKELEKNREDLTTAMGEESADAQIYVIEVELHRYIKHLTKKVDHIRNHVHHLHIK
jgi:hypothetical protein